MRLTRNIYLKAITLTVFVLIAAFVLWPNSVEATSADKTFIVQASATSVFVRCFSSGSMTIHLIDNRSGERRLIQQTSVGTIWSGDELTEVLWNADSRRFAVITMTTELPHEIYEAYSVRTTPLTVRDENEASYGVVWVENELQKRATKN